MKSPYPGTMVRLASADPPVGTERPMGSAAGRIQFMILFLDCGFEGLGFEGLGFEGFRVLGFSV